MKKIKTKFWWLRSRTLRWYTLILPALAGGVFAVEMSMGLLHSVLGPWQYLLFAFVVSSVGAYLRAKTSQPITGYRTPPQQFDEYDIKGGR